MTPDTLEIIARERSTARIREAADRRLVASRPRNGVRHTFADGLRRIADRLEPVRHETPCLNC